MYNIVYIHFEGQKGNFWLLFYMAVLTYHNSEKSIVGTDVLKCKSISSTQWHRMCPPCIPLSPRNIGHRWVQDLDEASYCGPTNAAFRVAHGDYWEKLYIISEFCSNEDSDTPTILSWIEFRNLSNLIIRYIFEAGKQWVKLTWHKMYENEINIRLKEKMPVEHATRFHHGYVNWCQLA